MDIEASMIVEFDEIEEIKSAPIGQALSYTMSLTKKYCVIGTQNGFCLVDNGRKSFRRFEIAKNPFKKQAQTGVQMGTALQQRSQVAIIPSRSSKTYSKTTVYIFDYHLKTILYSNDFFLPIRQMSLTDDTIIVANNKRIIIYNYSNDQEVKDQAYYLRMYESQQPNDRLRYLEMSCEERLLNNSIREMDGEDQRSFKACMCGKYAISGTKPYKIVYSKVYTLNGTKMTQLSIYNFAYDKDYVFQSFSYNEPFLFTISEDGNFVAYSQNYGKYVKVYKLGEKGVYSYVWISNSIKECLSHGFFTYDDNLWFSIIRRGENSTGRMHFYRILKKKQEKEVVQPRYRRYFSLFEKTIIDYGISNTLIGPDFYVVNGGVFVPSVCGAVVEIIDMKLSGNHISKNSENMVKWVQDLS